MTAAATSTTESLRGLDEPNRQRQAEAFFDDFDWDGVTEPDPKSMTAERFLDLL